MQLFFWLCFFTRLNKYRSRPCLNLLLSLENFENFAGVFCLKRICFVLEYKNQLQIFRSQPNLTQWRSLWQCEICFRIFSSGDKSKKRIHEISFYEAVVFESEICIFLKWSIIFLVFHWSSFLKKMECSTTIPVIGHFLGSHFQNKNPDDSVLLGLLSDSIL